MKNRFISISVLTFIISYSFGQSAIKTPQSDTIYIYETVEVYDTIVVYDTVKVVRNFSLNKLESIKTSDLKVLLVDTLNNKADLLIISKEKSATISLDGIILNENLKNTKSMKKLSFLGVVMFAFQSMVMSQTQYGVCIGGGTWWAKCNKPVFKSEYTSTFNAGMFVEVPLNSYLFLGSEFNFQYLQSNYSYKACAYSIGWVSTEYPGTQSFNNGVVGETESATNYYQLSMPVNIGFQVYRFKPYAGIRFSYRLSDSWANVSVKSAGINVGVNYPVFKRLSVGINYYKGLTKDFEHTGDTYNCETMEIIETNKYNWKSSWVGINLNYSFDWKKKKE
jgi:hypothetical protein